MHKLVTSKETIITPQNKRTSSKTQCLIACIITCFTIQVCFAQDLAEGGFENASARDRHINADLIAAANFSNKWWIDWRARLPRDLPNSFYYSDEQNLVLEETFKHLDKGDYATMSKSLLAIAQDIFITKHKFDDVLIVLLSRSGGEAANHGEIDLAKELFHSCYNLLGFPIASVHKSGYKYFLRELNRLAVTQNWRTTGDACGVKNLRIVMSNPVSTRESSAPAYSPMVEHEIRIKIDSMFGKFTKTVMIPEQTIYREHKLKVVVETNYNRPPGPIRTSRWEAQVTGPCNLPEDVILADDFYYFKEPDKLKVTFEGALISPSGKLITPFNLSSEVARH